MLCKDYSNSTQFTELMYNQAWEDSKARQVRLCLLKCLSVPCSVFCFSLKYNRNLNHYILVRTIARACFAGTFNSSPETFFRLVHVIVCLSSSGIVQACCLNVRFLSKIAQLSCGPERTCGEVCFGGMDGCKTAWHKRGVEMERRFRSLRHQGAPWNDVLRSTNRMVMLVSCGCEYDLLRKWFFLADFQGFVRGRRSQ